MRRNRGGVRTLLNLGHTFGHALEAATGYGQYTHGEAVGIGLLCAARMSIALGFVPEGHYDRILSLLEKMGLPTRIRGVNPKGIWEAMKRDKKFIHGRNRFVVLEDIGRAGVVEDVDPEVLTRALDAHLDEEPVEQQ
jgi:3-dehydroquinate synthase